MQAVAHALSPCQHRHGLEHGADAADFGKRERAERLDRAHRTNAYRRPQPARHLSLSDAEQLLPTAIRKTVKRVIDDVRNAENVAFALANGKY